MWYNNLPNGKEVVCHLSPIKALPLKHAKITNPAVTLGDRTLRFPTQLETGCYIEFISMSDCKVYDAKGEVKAELKPQGDVPVLHSHSNEVMFTYDRSDGPRPRAEVTVICRGEPIE